MYIELDYDRLSVEQKGVIDKLISMGDAKEISWKDCFAGELTKSKKESAKGYPLKTLERASELFKYTLSNKAGEYVDTKDIDTLWLQYLREVSEVFRSSPAQVFTKGDKVYHKNLGWYGIFLGYAWESDEECDVDFETEDGLEQRHVTVAQLEKM